ncbi:hypothetical protein Tcan_01315, partial [Toxocara canis]
STVDHIFAVTQSIERGREYRVSLCLLFVCFKKAFDTVKHNAVLKVLSNQRIDHTVYVRTSKDPLTRSHTEIALFDEPIKIRVGRGVKQRDICSPKVFTCPLEDVLWNMKMTVYRLRSTSNALICKRRGACFLTIAENLQTLQGLLNELRSNAKTTGLEIHSGKT